MRSMKVVHTRESHGPPQLASSLLPRSCGAWPCSHRLALCGGRCAVLSERSRRATPAFSLVQAHPAESSIPQPGPRQQRDKSGRVQSGRHSNRAEGSSFRRVQQECSSKCRTFSCRSATCPWQSDPAELESDIPEEGPAPFNAYPR